MTKIADMYVELKKLSAAKKAAKAKLDEKVNAAWDEYKKYVNGTYKPGRKEVIDEINKLKAEKKAAVKAKKVETKKVELKAKKTAVKAKTVETKKPLTKVEKTPVVTEAAK